MLNFRPAFIVRNQIYVRNSEWCKMVSKREVDYVHEHHCGAELLLSCSDNQRCVGFRRCCVDDLENQPTICVCRWSEWAIEYANERKSEQEKQSEGVSEGVSDLVGKLRCDLDKRLVDLATLRECVVIPVDRIDQFQVPMQQRIQTA